VITDHLMLDVLRSTTTTPGELCVVTTLTTEQHKSHALCLDLSEFLSAIVKIQIIYITLRKKSNFTK